MKNEILLMLALFIGTMISSSLTEATKGDPLTILNDTS